MNTLFARNAGHVNMNKAIDIEWIKEKAKAASGPKAFYYSLLVAEWEKEHDERTDRACRVFNDKGVDRQSL